MSYHDALPYLRTIFENVITHDMFVFDSDVIISSSLFGNTLSNTNYRCRRNSETYTRRESLHEPATKSYGGLCLEDTQPKNGNFEILCFASHRAFL